MYETQLKTKQLTTSSTLKYIIDLLKLFILLQGHSRLVSLPSSPEFFIPIINYLAAVGSSTMLFLSQNV